MMTFKDLKKLVELPSYKEQRVPTVKALEVSGVPVVTEKVLENHGSINVYQNGYVIYRAHKRVTVFSLRDCVHYKYDAAEGAGHHIEEEEFDESAERKCRTCCVSVTFISVFDGTSFSGDRTKLSAGVFYQVVYIGHTRDNSETVGRA